MHSCALAKEWTNAVPTGGTAPNGERVQGVRRPLDVQILAQPPEREGKQHRAHFCDNGGQ